MSEEAKQIPTQSGIQRMKPTDALQLFSNNLTLVEANSSKDRQRILDQIFNLVDQYGKMTESQRESIKLLKTEADRLKKLCKAHGIDASPPKVEQPKPKNRKERRAEARKQKKVIKKQARKKK